MSPKRIAAALLLAVTCAALWPSSALAQRRGGGRPGPGAGRPGPVVVQPRPVPSRTVVVSAWYAPLYFDPFYYDPFYQYPFGRYPRGYYSGYYGQPYRYREESSIRFQVTPKQAEVYIDGYYAGTVDDFDGTFQRLRTEPGEHEIALYLEGYRTVHQRVYLQVDATFRVKYTMEPLRPGDVQEPRPAATSTPATRAPRRQARDRDQDDPQGPSDRPVDRQGPPQRPRGVPRQPPAERPQPPVDDQAPRPQRNTSAFGTVAIRVQPAGADVFIDGERWEGPGDDERLIIQLAPGTHRIEAKRDGYRDYEGSVDVRRGETVALNIALPRR